MEHLCSSATLEQKIEKEHFLKAENTLSFNSYKLVCHVTYLIWVCHYPVVFNSMPTDIKHSSLMSSDEGTRAKRKHN